MNCKYCRANCTGAKHDREIALCLGYDPPKTYGDFIRSMTDEELAHFLDNTDGAFPPNVDHCFIEESEGYWLDWLKQEAGE